MVRPTKYVCLQTKFPGWVSRKKNQKNQFTLVNNAVPVDGTKKFSHVMGQLPVCSNCVAEQRLVFTS